MLPKLFFWFCDYAGRGVCISTRPQQSSSGWSLRFLTPFPCLTFSQYPRAVDFHHRCGSRNRGHCRSFRRHAPRSPRVFKSTLVASGSAGNVLVMRAGSASEMLGGITLDSIRIVQDAPGVCATTRPARSSPKKLWEWCRFP